MSSIILVRTTWIGDDLLNLMNRLSAHAAMPVAALVDNRRRPPLAATASIVPLNDAALEQLGLYCPPDVGWRCGDYGLYIARKQFPEVKRFWLIEDDLLIAGNVKEFFCFFQRVTNVDFLAARYMRADWGWYWWTYAQGARVTPYRCQFGILRISATALDHLYTKRLRHSRLWFRRFLWPNDEAFVATSVSTSNLTGADLNDFGRDFYTDESYRLEGEPHIIGPEIGPPTILHPVRLRTSIPADAATSARDRYTRQDSLLARKSKAVVRRFNRLMTW